MLHIHHYLPPLWMVAVTLRGFAVQVFVQAEDEAAARRIGKQIDLIVTETAGRVERLAAGSRAGAVPIFDD